jgi:serine/threonine-protein kinase
MHGVRPGTTLGGRYHVERLLASGSMGEVWLAVHGELRMRVALKTLRREMAGHHEIVTRFSREAFLLSRIQSEHVVRVLDFLVDRRVGPALVTEFIDGVPLSAMLSSRRFTVEEVVELAIDLVSGLRELHRAHIVHRDVKPSNVLMRRTGDDCTRAVFIDLGISRLLPEVAQSEDEALTDITTDDRAVGTFEYMAPEQILNSRKVTEAADLYAVGAILYRAITGQNVFGSVQGIELLQRKLASPAPPLDTGRSDRVAVGFHEVVGRALAMAPENRYELAEEMLADLSLLRDTARRAAQPTRATSTSRPPPPRGPATAMQATWRRRALAAACISIATLVGVAAGALGAGRIARRASPPPAASATPAAARTPEPHGAGVRALACELPADDGR